MHSRIVTYLSAIALIAATLLVSATTPRGTPAEAKALLQKAAAHFKEVGREKAFADFTAGKAPFKDRDLYVVCVAPDGQLSANGAFPQYVGMSADMLKDGMGKRLGSSIVGSVASKPEGSVTYPMLNPATGKMESKTLFTMKLGTDVCGVGAYSAAG